MISHLLKSLAVEGNDFLHFNLHWLIVVSLVIEQSIECDFLHRHHLAFLINSIGETKNAEPIESSDSQRIRHNEQETVGNFVKVFRNKKEQSSEISLQICFEFS